VIAPARRACYEVLQRIEIHGRFSDDALHSKRVNDLSPADRRLTTEIVLGVLRWQGWLDHALAGAVSRPREKVDARIRILLRMSLYQIARMERIPEFAAVHDAVELAKDPPQRGAERFVNGVLRRLCRTRPWLSAEFERSCPPWAACSLPEWLWSRWENRFGFEKAKEYALSLLQPPVQAFWTAGDGRVHFQDEASQLIAHLFGRIEGKRVWDACAAPGGKFGILLGLVGERGTAVASDLSSRRLRRVGIAAGGAGRSATALVLADASRPPFRVRFDAVLADVPCSGLGTLRRNPEIKWRLEPDTLLRLQGIQRRILAGAASAVRPGGMLLYSTCSTEPEENEQVVDWFLAERPGFRLERPSCPASVDPWLDERGCFRSFPGAPNWDGFFAALMVHKKKE